MAQLNPLLNEKWKNFDFEVNVSINLINVITSMWTWNSKSTLMLMAKISLQRNQRFYWQGYRCEVSLILTLSSETPTYQKTSVLQRFDMNDIILT